jgi:hypothetical protein
MQWRKLFMPLFCGAVIVATACTQPAAAPATTGGEANAAPAATSNTLTAIKVDAVAADGAAAFWADAPALTVATKGSVEGAAAGPEVKVQAVYDAQNVAMRFEWADASASVMKNGWQWDGDQFTKSGDEDRVQLLWPIQNNGDFASKGCAAACHNSDADQDKWWMGTESADLSYDLWHWKAARTNPVGQSDDQWVGVLADPADMESSRYGDAKESGGYKDNVNEAGDGPAFMHGQDATAQFILTGQEVALDPTALTGGAVVPGFVIAPAVGSRGDVTANGVWQDGKWVVVLMRALDTGHEDDVTFTPPKAYPFGLGVTDDGGGTDHTVAPEVLTLEWQ